MRVPAVPFGDAIRDVSAGNIKIAQSEFLGSGRLAVVDQGKSLVAGYTDEVGAAVTTSGAVIVFGDHTRALKFVDFPFAMGADGTKVLQVREGLDPKYVYWYLASLQIPSAGYSRHFKFLKQISVPVPPISEQRRIAAILDHADALRTKRRQALAHLDALTQSIFHDMFPLEEFSHITLGEICRFYSGGTPPKKNAELWDGSLPWFSPKDLKATDLYDSTDHISEKVPLETSIRLLPRDTVTVVVRGMILAHTVPVSTLRVEGAINQDLKALLPLPHIDLETDFLAAAVRSRRGWLLARVSTAAHGTKKLDTAILAATPIPNVGLVSQRGFSERVRCLEQERLLAHQALMAAAELFASLQSRAFTGEL